MCLISLEVAAQRDSDGAGLSLREVVETTLQLGTNLELARREVEFGEGELVFAQALYDANLTATASGSRTEDPGSLALELTGGTTDQDSVFLGVERRFRSGVLVIPELGITQTDLGGAAPGLNAASFDLGFVVPLLKDRLGRIGRWTEEAAAVASSSDVSALDFEHSASLLDSVSAYWAYVAAQRRLEVFQASEERARRLVEDTRALVSGNERPAADLNQVEGNLSAKTIDRIGAEQVLAEARRLLGIAMGIPASQINSLPPPADELPQPQAFNPDAPAVSRLVDTALGQRADLRAASQLSTSRLLILQAAEDDQKARLDLSLVAGYRGLEEGSGPDRLFGALSGNTAGPSAALSFRYEVPLRNLAAKALVLQQRSLYEQRKIVQRDLRRRIGAAVAVAAEAVARSSRQALVADEAATLQQATVENEREKSRLGLATLFDVIFAEDRLTSTLLSRVEAQRSYATAVVVLRFETASLWPGAGATLSIASLTEIPTGEGT